MVTLPAMVNLGKDGSSASEHFSPVDHPVDNTVSSQVVSLLCSVVENELAVVASTCNTYQCLQYTCKEIG